MGDTSIEWTGKTVNPIRARRKDNGKPGWACVKISPGCTHCYAEKQNVQCGNNPGRYGTGLSYTVPSLDQVELYFDDEAIKECLRWRKPQRVFPCSMTDWCWDRVPDEWRDKIMAVAALTPQHTYQMLTKRAEGLRDYLNDPETPKRALKAMGKFGAKVPDVLPWPLPNVWQLVSVEDQQRADERISFLLQAMAAVRGLSVEPMLGPVDVRKYLTVEFAVCPASQPRSKEFYDAMGIVAKAAWKHAGGGVIDWVICGGESGPNARPMNPDWARSLRDQCAAAGVKFFFKQWGEHAPVYADSPDEPGTHELRRPDGKPEMRKVGKKAAGRLLDGKEHNEYPNMKGKHQ